MHVYSFKINITFYFEVYTPLNLHAYKISQYKYSQRKK